jgi:uncharacterized membrane protein YkvA (DUF1232 family)
VKNKIAPSPLYVRDLRHCLEQRQISPEKLASDVQLSHMTIRRWLKRKDSEPLPRKYSAILGPVLAGVPTIDFSQAMERGTLGSADMAKLMQEVEKSGQDFKDVPSLESDLRTKLKTARFDKIFIDSCRRLLQSIKSPKTPLRAKAVCVGALLYFISPIDLIPDNIPVLGYLDDIAVLSLALDFAGRAVTESEKAQRTKTPIAPEGSGFDQFLPP